MWVTNGRFFSPWLTTFPKYESQTSFSRMQDSILCFQISGEAGFQKNIECQNSFWPSGDSHFRVFNFLKWVQIFHWPDLGTQFFTILIFSLVQCELRWGKTKNRDSHQPTFLRTSAKLQQNNGKQRLTSAAFVQKSAGLRPKISQTSPRHQPVIAKRTNNPEKKELPGRASGRKAFLLRTTGLEPARLPTGT